MSAEKTNDGKKLLEWAEMIIFQRHYEMIKNKKPVPIDNNIKSISPGDVTCLYNISELVFDKEEGNTVRLTIALNALYSVGASALLLLQHQNGKSQLYIGAVNKCKPENRFYINTIREVLRSSIEGNLPGTELKEIVSRKEIENKLTQCIDNGFDSQCITSVSCVPAVEKAEVKNKGMDALLEAVGNHNFSFLIIADPVSSEKMRDVKRGYENLSTQLSSYSEVSYSEQWGSNVSYSDTFSKSFSTSVGQNISLTQSHSESNGWSSGISRASLALPGENSADKDNKAFALMDRVSAATLDVLKIHSGHVNQSNSHQSSDQQGVSQGKTSTETENVQNGTSETLGKSEGKTTQSTRRNRSVKEMIERIDWYLKWFNSCENYGMFDSCAYVISSSAGTNLMVASQFQALIQGEQEMNQPVTINTWTSENGIDIVKESLLHMSHPVIPGDGGENSSYSPAMLMSSRELARQMAVPQHSVVGLTVMEYASFGKEVVRKTPLKKGKLVRIGSVSHMGKTLKQPVVLDLQSMASHSFIAGTNGSGKSNAVFRIIEELMDASIPFMVIEPAKGEYKNVFGSRDDVKVYGTNRKKTELLRLNPFWFNEDVEVLEHIDKLIDIFNASWPMYAAMPAVLKSSIERAYVRCGWDLKQSVCKGKYRIFPTVEDVLNEFNNKMESTAFSKEVQGNYVGALSTRLESLCNGIYGEIFGGRNLSDEELFDSNVIIDLSRVGSAETKSMIMGMLIIRLQEYRMRTEAMNLPLKHITVLEEAHHLIRRTSTAQSEDGSNMMGKSVEMISNAIAEMRSYGEGFIIVDQSPGLMDMSVMRNTNTKIILRLPEAGDREMVGDTMGLTPEQTYEISRFKTGVCAIYQKDWLEPVLCQVDRASSKEELYTFSKKDDKENERLKTLVEVLVTGNKKALNCNPEEIILECSISGSLKKKLLKVLPDEISFDKKIKRELVCALTKLELELPEESVEQWHKELLEDALLKEQWGEYLEDIIVLTVEKLSSADNNWRKVLTEIPYVSKEKTEGLKQSRGRALARICPLNGMKAALTSEMREALENDYYVLMDSVGTDDLIAQILKESLDKDIVKKSHEMSPYTDIVWELMGGQKTFDELLPLLSSGDVEGWDRNARRILKEQVDADERTLTSLLDLFLVKKIQTQPVRTNISKWRMIAIKQKTDV